MSVLAIKLRMGDAVSTLNTLQRYRAYIMQHHLYVLLVYTSSFEEMNKENLNKKEGMSLEECRDDQPKEANHGDSSIDDLCITGEKAVALSWQSLEDWHSSCNGEDEEGECNRHWG